MDKNKFPKGAFFNLPHVKAPNFVKGQINIINKKEFIDWLNSHNGNELRLSLKQSREGKGYAEIDTYEPKGEVSRPNVVPSNFDDINDNLPF